MNESGMSESLTYFADSNFTFIFTSLSILKSRQVEVECIESARRIFYLLPLTTCAVRLRKIIIISSKANSAEGDVYILVRT